MLGMHSGNLNRLRVCPCRLLLLINPLLKCSAHGRLTSRSVSTTASCPTPPRSRDGRWWSMDFIHTQLAEVRSIRLFNLIDDFNREGLE